MADTGIYRHTPSTRKYKEIDDAMVKALTNGEYTPTMLLDLNNAANRCAVEFARVLEMLAYEGFKFSHNGDGEITAMYKDVNK